MSNRTSETELQDGESPAAENLPESPATPKGSPTRTPVPGSPSRSPVPGSSPTRTPVPGSPSRSPVPGSSPVRTPVISRTPSASPDSILKTSPPAKICPEECPDIVDIVDTDLTPGGQLNKSKADKPDAANTEFVYYSATLREVAPQLTSDVDRQSVIPWLRKLFRPEYHSSRFRTKRNKYLLYLSLTIMNDEIHGVFRSSPPQGALPDFETLPAIFDKPTVLAEWEKDTMWRDILDALPKAHDRMGCAVHVSDLQCSGDKNHGDLLDEEFAYLLYLARPFAVLLSKPDDRTRIAAWLQALCTIQPSSCSAMKHIRNDYMMSLLGYLHEMRVAGPFCEFPGWDPLPPLAEATRIMAQKYPPIDPCYGDKDEFFASQPIPDEGAFAFLAVTGEMLDSSVKEKE